MEGRKSSIKQLKAWLEQIDYSPSQEEYSALLRDGRSGVQSLLERIARKQALAKEQEQQWQEMCTYERNLYAQGYLHIAGVDEVGRGPLAGPVVSAAVILPPDCYLPGLTDSKQLSETAREVFYAQIEEQAIAIGIATVSESDIDQWNILQATVKAMQEAVALLNPQPSYLLVDALTLPNGIPQQGVIAGDRQSVSIAAASVIAKVTRDRLMKELAQIYPQYGFERNMGYGTKEHLQAIATHGVTEVHRRTFAGVKEWL